MQALRCEILQPSGVEYAASLRLLPSIISRKKDATDTLPKIICNLAIARSNRLRILEVDEELAPAGNEKDGWSRLRRDTEPVEGEVEMDTQGEGFVNIGAVKFTSKQASSISTTARLYHVREHQLHGIVTGLEAVKTIATANDGLDRLLISFKDAKIALMEWSSAVHDLITVSLHTYERAPQMLSFESSTFKALLRVDPNSQLAGLLLPKDAIAILPFYQSQAELDLMDLDQSDTRDIPYSPSFVLDLQADVDARIRNVIDFVLLPGFNSPTVAILFQSQQTWTGRLKEYKDTINLFIFTLDLVTRKYPIITAVENLPHDCISLVPCAPSLGGVIVYSSNALIYVDQASRKTALPVNGWASRVSDMSWQSLRPEELSRDLHMEGCKISFVDERTFFVILRDGTIYPVEIVMDGKIVSKLAMGAALAQTTIPATVTTLARDWLFVGSTVASSVLLKTTRSEEEVPRDHTEDESPAAVVDPPRTMELDDEDDIYGDVVDTTQSAPTLGHTAAVETRSVIHLSLCDSLPEHGPIIDTTFALTRNGDRPVAELVAATGHGRLGGFTLFQRDLPMRLKRKLHVVGGARGVWSLSVRQPLKMNGSSAERTLKPSQTDTDSVIISTDATPSPGLTRFASRTSRSEITITSRRTETTIGAAPFFQRTAILHVTTDTIQVLEPDGAERQTIKDMDGTVRRPRIRYSSISDPFVLVLREDDSLGLFVGDAERGRIRRKDMTPMGEKISRYSAGCFYSDQSGLFEVHKNPSYIAPNAGEANGRAKNATSSLEAAVDSQRGTQWLILCRPQGIVEIWTLPKLSIVFSTSVVCDLPSALVDSLSPPALSLPEDPPRKPHEFDIEQILVASTGESYPQPHLYVLLRCGQLAIYRAVASLQIEWPEQPERNITLPIRFVKVASRAIEVKQQSDLMERSMLAEQKRVLRHLIPFTTTPAPDVFLSGVFFTGDHPCWILATDKDGVKVHSCAFSVVNSFTACSIWDSKGDFLMYTDEGPCLIEWMPSINLGTSMPSRSVSIPRTYTNVVFDAATGLMVAASSLPNNFGLFDEDGNRMWEPDAPNVGYPVSETSSLELFAADFALILDGFEFLQNEFVNALEIVTLETLSTESGLKDFVAVGTVVNRGEDLAVKGAIYIFEIAEIVPDLDSQIKRNYRLRLLCRDEAKGPVTAVSGMNGYLVSSMGQKIFVRAFDMDERLVGVAFLDVGIYVTSIRTLKNLMLIGDVYKSVWFVAFQEDPFKLVVLAKDVRPVCVVHCDFLFSSDGQFYIATGDEEGVVRLYEYDPADPESRNGQHLMCRTEFHGQIDCRSTTLVARRTKEDDGLVPLARLISGASDGSVYSLSPVDDDAMKRLLVIQGQLTRNQQHVAGLNPKAFRIVRNDSVAKPLSKGILDGNLLRAFKDLSIAQQIEITKQIGSERATVLRDLMALDGPW